jgi:hypothetical protein
MRTKQGQAGAIEITPEMVIAGSAELAGRQEDDAGEICQDVFEAMLAAAGIQQSTPRLPLSAVQALRLRQRPPASQTTRLLDE